MYDPPLFRYLASRPRCALQPFPQKLRVGSSTLFVKVAEGFFRNVAVLRIVICDSSEGCVGRARGNLVYYGMVWVCVPRCHPPHLGLVRGEPCVHDLPYLHFDAGPFHLIDKMKR